MLIAIMMLINVSDNGAERWVGKSEEEKEHAKENDLLDCMFMISFFHLKPGLIFVLVLGYLVLVVH